MDCPFCSPISSPIFYESKLVVGLRSAPPAPRGRALIVPRRHIAAYFDASADEKAELWRAAEEIKLKLDAELRPGGYNLEIHEGAVGGPGEPAGHLSVHIIPRGVPDADVPRGEAGPFSALPRFVGGGGRHFVGAIRGALLIAERAELLVAFVQPSGVELLEADLVDAAARGVRIRVLTGDYLGITSPDALRALFRLKVLAHFRPRFLLGLTATPDRTDGESLLQLCDDNLVIRRDLIYGVRQGLLVPFHYFGVKDCVDFAPIPWRSGRFDADSLTAAVATQERSEQVLRAYRAHADQEPHRTLAFCCSIRHADHMAEFFRAKGIAAVAVHSGPGSAPRAGSLRRLVDGELEILCAVDIFNEGLDVCNVNTILMLRPTESPIIFLQQIGRGLRLSPDKGHLSIVDFIGNHRSFLMKPQAIVHMMGEEIPAAAALRRLRQGSLDLPAGCRVEIETEALDMLEALIRISGEDALVQEYAAFRDAHGRRPSATELYSRGVKRKTIRSGFGGWFELVASRGDLTEDEQRLLCAHSPWFQHLFAAKMTRSHAMLALDALIQREHLFDGAEVAEIAERALASARHRPLLWRELAEGEPEDEPEDERAAFVERWREERLVWGKGKSAVGSWFALQGDRVVLGVDVELGDRAVFEAMTAELIEARIEEHLHMLRRRQPVDAREVPIVMVVSNHRGSPILRFDRARRPDFPTGELEVEIDGRPHVIVLGASSAEVVRDPQAEGNVLPALLKRWFGPAAGLPGARRRTELFEDGRWVLRPLAGGQGQRAADGQGIPSPLVAYFNDLEVACGALAGDVDLAQVETLLAVETTRELDRKRHFVVRASGDSMDGGERPIRDGDLVLCEWLGDSSPLAVEGKAHLLVGSEGPERSFAAIKVPLRQEGAWILRSWNAAYKDQALPLDATLEPVARALEVVTEATGFGLYDQYSRSAIAAAFGHNNNPSWKVGHRDVNAFGRAYTVLMVTLRKATSVPLEHRYADSFLSRTEFQWESQASTTPESQKGKRIRLHEAEGRTVHLFVRYEDRDDFTYCGPIRFQRCKGEKPMRVWWALERRLPEGLWRRWRR